MGVDEFNFYQFFYIGERTCIRERHTKPLYKPLTLQAIKPIQSVAQSGRNGDRTMGGASQHRVKLRCAVCLTLDMLYLSAL